MEVLCVQGTIWITLKHDYNDHILHDGTKFLPGCNDLVVIWALTDALLVVRDLTTEGEKEGIL